MDNNILEQIRLAINIYDLVSETVELQRAGAEYRGRCPYHPDTHPSLFVNPEKGFWHCFGCGAGGDVFSWIMRREQCDFLEAVRYLCQRCHLPYYEPPPEEQAAENTERLARQLLGKIAACLAQQLPGSAGESYLRERGIPLAVAQKWQVGYLADPEQLSAILERYSAEVCRAAGLAGKNGLQFFHRRVVFPLIYRGAVLNFYGRSLVPPEEWGDEEQYKSQKHRFLSKRPLLPFGLDKAKRPIVIVEGLFDALSVETAGYHAIALGGLNTQQHLPHLSRLASSEFFIGLDADSENGKGPRRALELAAALGLQGRHCLIVDWPAKDPNEVLLTQGREALQAAIQTALPPVIYRQRKNLIGVIEQPLLQQEGSNLIMEGADRRRYVVKHIDNESDPKGLRVTLQLYHDKHRLNVDVISMASAIARQRFARNAQKAYARLATDDISQAVEEELLLLEEEIRSYLALQSQSQAEPAIPKEVPAMTDAEREEALSLLRDPNLLWQVTEDVHTLGVVGEDEAIQLTWLTMTSRLMDDPLYLIFKGESSVGKSFLLQTVAELCPPEDLRSFTRITAQALFWTEDPATFLKHKFLIVSERPGGEGADYSIRTMLSEKGLSLYATERIDDQLVSRMRVVEGPMAYAETTTALEINNENETRLLEVYLDSSKEQTGRIHEHQRWRFTLEGRLHEADREAIKRRHHNAQRLLRPIQVVIPFAKYLTFPTERVRTRRDNLKLLNLIAVVAFAHQYQREEKTAYKGGQEIRYIEATLQDYDHAYRLARTIFAVSLDELDKRSRELFKQIVEMVQERWYRQHQPAQADLLERMEATPPTQELLNISFTKREVAEFSGRSLHTVGEILAYLVEMDLIRTPGGRPGQTYRYYLQYIPAELLAQGNEEELAWLRSPEDVEAAMELDERNRNGNGGNGINGGNGGSRER